MDASTAISTLAFNVDKAYLRQQFAVTADRERLYVRVNATEELRGARRKEAEWLALCNHFEAFGVVGTVLRDATCRRWCMITPDPKPGRYRYTHFDERGFIGHGEYLSSESAVVAAFNMGYRYLDCTDEPHRVMSAWP